MPRCDEARMHGNGNGLFLSLVRERNRRSLKVRAAVASHPRLLASSHLF